jgi:hypothetical protein
MAFSMIKRLYGIKRPSGIIRDHLDDEAAIRDHQGSNCHMGSKGHTGSNGHLDNQTAIRDHFDEQTAIRDHPGSNGHLGPNGHPGSNGHLARFLVGSWGVPGSPVRSKMAEDDPEMAQDGPKISPK